MVFVEPAQRLGRLVYLALVDHSIVVRIECPHQRRGAKERAAGPGRQWSAPFAALAQLAAALQARASFIAASFRPRIVAWLLPPISIAMFKIAVFEIAIAPLTGPFAVAAVLALGMLWLRSLPFDLAGRRPPVPSWLRFIPLLGKCHRWQRKSQRHQDCSCVFHNALCFIATGSSLCH